MGLPHVADDGDGSGRCRHRSTCRTLLDLVCRVQFGCFTAVVTADNNVSGLEDIRKFWNCQLEFGHRRKIAQMETLEDSAVSVVV